MKEKTARIKAITVMLSVLLLSGCLEGPQRMQPDRDAVEQEYIRSFADAIPEGAPSILWPENFQDEMFPEMSGTFSKVYGDLRVTVNTQDDIEKALAEAAQAGKDRIILLVPGKIVFERDLNIDIERVAFFASNVLARLEFNGFKMNLRATQLEKKKCDHRAAGDELYLRFSQYIYFSDPKYGTGGEIPRLTLSEAKLKVGGGRASIIMNAAIDGPLDLDLQHTASAVYFSVYSPQDLVSLKRVEDAIFLFSGHTYLEPRIAETFLSSTQVVFLAGGLPLTSKLYDACVSENAIQNTMYDYDYLRDIPIVSEKNTVNCQRLRDYYEDKINCERVSQ
jgi:hypothetical protein